MAQPRKTEPGKTEPGMSAVAFMAWYETQSPGRRFELLDGAVHEMQAERLVHAEVKLRVAEQIRRQITERRLPCQGLGDGMAVYVDEETVFEPDAQVRCGPPLPADTTLIRDPLIVVEVASPSTQGVDALWKFSRYFRNPSITHYLIVLPDMRNVLHHRRTADGRIESQAYDAGSIVLDPPGLDLAVVDLFTP